VPNQVLYSSDASPSRIHKLTLDGKLLGALGQPRDGLLQRERALRGGASELACAKAGGLGSIRMHTDCGEVAEGFQQIAEPVMNVIGLRYANPSSNLRSSAFICVNVGGRPSKY
jgi:hypothetical protein